MLELVMVLEVSVIQALWSHVIVLSLLLDLTLCVSIFAYLFLPWTYLLPGPACLRLQRKATVPGRDSHLAHHSTKLVFFPSILLPPHFLQDKHPVLQQNNQPVR